MKLVSIYKETSEHSELVKEIYLESETSEPNVVKVVKLMKLVNLWVCGTSESVNLWN